MTLEQDDEALMQGLADLLVKNGEGQLHARASCDQPSCSRPHEPSSSTSVGVRPTVAGEEDLRDDPNALVLPRPGLVIDGKRRLTQYIGAGAFGSVHEAWHLDLDRLEAIKFLHERWMAPDYGEVVARFLAEARVMARLRGHHLVDVHDCGTLPGGLPFFVMERLHGKTLRARLCEQTEISLPELFELAIPLLQGLCEVHEHGVVHRDVKPENIFLAEQGLKLLDFGLAKTSVAMTMTDAVMGTPLYMAPELISGRGQPDARTDLYATSAVMYEMLAGHPPFRPSGTSRRELEQAIVHEAPASLSTYREGIPAELEALVCAGLSKRQDDRPGAARAMLDRLIELRRGWAGAARIDTQPQAERLGGSAASSDEPKDPPLPDAASSGQGVARWNLVLKLDSIDDRQLYDVLDVLRRVTGDPSITLVRVDAGSIILVLEMSEQAATRVTQLADSDALSQQLDVDVIGFARERGDEESGDFRLSDAWASGDGLAGEQLFNRYFDMVYRFFRTKVPEVCQELTQATFETLVSRRSRPEGRRSFRAFVLSIAFDELQRHLRARGHEGSSSGEEPFELLVGSPDQKLLVRALQRIPLEHQVVIELHYWEGMSSSEIGETLGVPASTVQDRRVRANALLKQRLEELADSQQRVKSTLVGLRTWAADLRGKLRSDQDASVEVVLLRRWREGHREAGETLVRRHYAFAYRVAHRLVGGDRKGAEEVTQLAFESLLHGCDEIEGDVKGYLRRVVMLEVLAHRRRRQPDAGAPEAQDSVMASREELDRLVEALRRMSPDEP